MCAHWVSRCAMGVRVGLGPTEAYHDPVLGPEGHQGPYASISESFAYPPGGPSTLATSVSSKLLHLWQLPHPSDPISRSWKLRRPRTSTSASPGSSSSRSPMPGSSRNREKRKHLGRQSPAAGPKSWDRTVAKPLKRVSPRRHGNEGARRLRSFVLIPLLPRPPHHQ